jgi:hypothetical protein
MWTRSREVAAPAADVWMLLTDVRRWPEWGPTVAGARLDVGTQTTISQGATGRVRTPVGVWLPFTVTQLSADAAGGSWSWQVAGVPATRHEVLDLGGGASRVRFATPWWAPAYVPVVELGLRRLGALAEREWRSAAPT